MSQHSQLGFFLFGRKNNPTEVLKHHWSLTIAVQLVIPGYHFDRSAALAETSDLVEFYAAIDGNNPDVSDWVVNDRLPQRNLRHQVPSVRVLHLHGSGVAAIHDDLKQVSYA